MGAVQSGRCAYMWSSVGEDGTWKPCGGHFAGVSCGLHASMILEQAYRKGELKGLKHNRIAHQIHVDPSGSTTRVEVKRDLARTPVPVRTDLPEFWTPMITPEMGGEKAVVCRLLQDDDEYIGMKHLFTRHGEIPGANILEIYRVQNPRLVHNFADKKEELAKKYRRYGLNLVEQKMFHGTKWSSIKGICEENFDWRRSGEAHGDLYGRGVYFGSEPSLAHKFTFASTIDKSRIMVIASVLVGLTCKGDKNISLPPEWHRGVPYDTTVDNVTNPKIFVKYDSAQYHPTHLVRYNEEQNE